MLILAALFLLKWDEIFPDFVRRIRFLSVSVTIGSAVSAALGLVLHFSSHHISFPTLWVLAVIFVYGVTGIVLTFLVKQD